MIRRMGKDATQGMMEMCILVSGRMTSKMEKVMRSSKMDQNTKGCTRMARNTVMVSTNGAMDVNTRETSNKTFSTAKEHTIGILKSTQANGITP